MFQAAIITVTSCLKTFHQHYHFNKPGSSKPHDTPYRHLHYSPEDSSNRKLISYPQVIRQLNSAISSNSWLVL